MPITTGAARTYADNADEAPESKAAEKEEIEMLDPSTLHVKKLGEEETQDIEEEGNTLSIDPDQMVRVSIFLKGKSTLDQGFTMRGIAKNKSAAEYRNQLKKTQSELTSKIENRVGHKLNVKWNLTLVANAISVEIPYKDIERIEKLPEVESVELEMQYEAPRDAVADHPNTANTSGNMVGAQDAWGLGYTGAGSRVAIIDTGLDITHQSVAEDPFLYSINELQNSTGKTYTLFTQADLDAVASQLNSKSNNRISAKIPYGYNYVDNTDEYIDHLNDTQGEHGSHVAGIAAANKYLKIDGVYKLSQGEVDAVGMAPDAQLFIMKVFGADGGAYDSDYMVAIEDAVYMDCDVVNLSLGSAVQGWTFSNSYQDKQNSFADQGFNEGMVISISAGNSYSLVDMMDSYVSRAGLYIEDVNMHTGGSPGTFVNSLCVAAAQNTLTKGVPLFFDGDTGHKVFYAEFTEGQDGTTTAGNPIANVSGGGSYTIGDTATLVAPTVAGFTFKGWYPVGGDITTDRLSAAQTFEYTVRADNNNLIAVYEADSGAKFRLTITGTRFTITDNTHQNVTTQRGRFDEDYEASSSITVTYTGSDNFLYWINSKKKIVSTDPAYTFTLVANIDIDAVYSEQDSDNTEALVLFVHSRTYGQVISQRYYNLNETIIYPVAPVKAGKTFTGWDKTEEQIKDLIRTGETRIPVYPNYASNGEQYTITLEYWVNNVKQDEEQYAVDVGSTKVLTVGSKYNLNGEDFSYWTDAEGHILGYNNEKYVVWQTGDYTVRAVYNGATEKLPIVRMTNAFATQNGEDCYINFTSVRSIPDGYSVEKSGILYASINRIPLANAKDQMTIWYKENGENGAYVNEFPLESKELEEASTIYFFVPQAIQGTQIIGRAYVVIKNITTGEITYLYSDNIIYASYNELVNKQFHNQELNALN